MTGKSRIVSSKFWRRNIDSLFSTCRGEGRLGGCWNRTENENIRTSKIVVSVLNGEEEERGKEKIMLDIFK